MAESITTTLDQHVQNTSPQSLGEGQCPEKMQGHWVLARTGKRALRPGGLELTRGMLAALEIGLEDRVVEFAPGLGVTARMVLQRRPAAYWAVERDAAAADHLRKDLAGAVVRIINAPADASGLANACATVVYGEAMLSMQNPEQKGRIFREARRLLGPEGRYGIHELCFTSEASDDLKREIQSEFSKEIHMGVQPLSRREWVGLFKENGMDVIWSATAPMHLLEPGRLLRDEGVWRALRIGLKVVTTPALRRRIIAMQKLFRRYQACLCAIILVGQVDFCRELIARESPDRLEL